MTFRLAGSLPQHVIAQWQKEQRWLRDLARINPSHYELVNADFERKWFAKFEAILDRASVGPVWLSDDRIAAIITESLHHRDGEVYRLDAFTIMTNHVHAVIKPLPIPGEEDLDQSISAIMQSLKGYTSFKCNRLLGREGEFWAHESYDHWIRNNDEWQRIIAYVLNNPLKAGYVKRWQEWKWNYRRV